MSLPLCFIVCVHIVVAMCEKAGNSCECGCGTKAMFPWFHDCVKLPLVFPVSISVCDGMLISVSWLTCELWVYAYSSPACIPIHPHTFMHGHNGMKLSTFGTLIPRRDRGHLLAIDTAGDAIWEHHTLPVPSPSKRGSSRRLVSIPMTGDKESSEITRWRVQLRSWWRVAGRSPVIRRLFTYSVLMFHYRSCVCPNTLRWYVWGVFKRRFRWICLPRNHTPVWWTGRKREGEGEGEEAVD